MSDLFQATILTTACVVLGLSACGKKPEGTVLYVPDDEYFAKLPDGQRVNIPGFLAGHPDTPLSEWGLYLSKDAAEMRRIGQELNISVGKNLMTFKGPDCHNVYVDVIGEKQTEFGYPVLMLEKVESLGAGWVTGPANLAESKPDEINLLVTKRCEPEKL